MKVDIAIEKIEGLIREFGDKAENDDDYLEMLREMEERASTAISAQEEGNEGKDSKTSSGT